MQNVKKKLVQSYKWIVTRPLLAHFILLIPIVIIYSPMLLTGYEIYLGDFDMQTQMTEAARKTIVEHGQFPFWNPWVSGGVPLFADPQFGLISPQTILAILIGSVFAWKVTMVLYMMVGFLSMKKLLEKLTESSFVTNVLISYIWVFSSMFILRTTGHFTFILFALLPLGIYLGLNLAKGSKKDIVLFTLFLAFCLYQALHYSIFMIFIVVFAILAMKSISLSTKLDKKKFLSILTKFDTKFILRIGLALIAAIAIASPRLYMSLEYMNDNLPDRIIVPEKYIGIDNGLRAVFCPYQLKECVTAKQFAQDTTWGMFEASTYIGITTGIAMLASAYIVIRKKLLTKKDIVKISPYVVLMVIAILLGLGGFIYNTFAQLPVLSSMRVSTRWLFIAATLALILLAVLAAKILHARSSSLRVKRGIICLLLVALIEVSSFNFYLSLDLWKPSFLLQDIPPTSHNSKTVLSQELRWHQWTKHGANYYAVTEATYNNIGQLRADTALLETSRIGTNRCDKDDASCNFVTTNNANVALWTPNKIVLQRTAPGDITLNMNPGTHWRVNDRYPFLGVRTSDSYAKFTIKDKSDTINILYTPLPTSLIERLENAS